MKFRVQHQQAHTGMNLVPLIDVLFILLIFFIVTFAMARFETELNISVPAASAATESSRQKGELVINVRKDGTLVWNSKVLDEPQLMAQLQEISRFDRKRAIIIRGDMETHYDKIVRVLNVTHAAGLYHVSFATRQPEESSP
ncbi:MAG TPA: biopolymer transporter ExbD [Verrucomicrobiales bacterium]|jgi:biopolymer transport protein ExbD|nr:biopolymer transporter ExbD [Verrucomicrobiales bacterium]